MNPLTETRVDGILDEVKQLGGESMKSMSNALLGLAFLTVGVTVAMLEAANPLLWFGGVTMAVAGTGITWLSVKS